MQEDIFPAAEKILNDIENIFKKDLNLISFEIIPAEDNKNISPVYHAQNSLGLASWCIQPLYYYVYNQLLDIKRKQQRRTEFAVISRWLLGALLLNPDMSSFWNMRREFLRNGNLKHADELRFVNIVLYYKAKCFEAFSYRRWLLKFILIDSKELIQNADIIFRNEMQITSMAADRYGNNYHAWSHREYIISMFEVLATSKFYSFLENEWEESTKWCNCHVSDYSGFVYRQFLLNRLLFRKQFEQIMPSLYTTKRRDIIFRFVKAVTKYSDHDFFLHTGSSKEVLDRLHGYYAERETDTTFDRTLISLSYWAEDCLINYNLIKIFPGHETLWYHRRFLVYSLLGLNYSYSNFFLYKSDGIKEFQEKLYIEKDKLQKFSTTNQSKTKSLLQLALCSHNKDLINTAKQHGSHQIKLSENFFNYLIKMKLDT